MTTATAPDDHAHRRSRPTASARSRRDASEAPAPRNSGDRPSGGAAGAPATQGDAGEPLDRLKAAGERVLVALVNKMAELALEKVDDLASSLEEVAANGGVGLSAALGAGKAMAAGKSPLWGALKGGFSALGDLAKALVVVVLALSPVLLVVALVVLVVALLVWAIIAAIRAATD
ncbi:hypothetical protein WIS52_26480 [Pseudonocardia nematodicida]|uniref:Superfamily III holin-X n=1 Tax=Pseudonocardia nematodicida TaxID=1206997 RepID=A0ABV1KHU8_9PSEU